MQIISFEGKRAVECTVVITTMVVLARQAEEARILPKKSSLSCTFVFALVLF
jgi:hypothetical protein